MCRESELQTLVGRSVERPLPVLCLVCSAPVIPDWEAVEPESASMRMAFPVNAIHSIDRGV